MAELPPSHELSGLRSGPLQMHLTMLMITV
jgi:hypothetical protein